MSPAVVILPAYNEAPRIAPIVESARRATMVARVLVVDDGSKDGTSSVAKQAGAEVLRLPSNLGKGQAMLAGVRATREPIVLFLGADLTGLTPGHVERLIGPVANGSCVMTAGLRDYGRVWGELQQALPRIGGERAVLRSVLDRVPLAFWNGFQIEAGMNAMAHKMGRICDVTLYGVSMGSRRHKTIPAAGLLNGVRMLREVMFAMGEAQRL